MDTPRLLPQPPLLLEGFEPETTLPLYQEGVGGGVIALYSCITGQMKNLVRRVKFIIFNATS